MPTEAQKLAIEQNRLGLRVVNPQDKFDSGSCYYLFPVEDDWDRKLLETADFCGKASAPDKKLHLLADLNRVESGAFSSGGFSYGRVTGRPRSVASVSLYGNESASAIAGWVMRQINSLVPTERTITVTAPPPRAVGRSRFAECCAAIAYVLCCCNPKYKRLLDSEEVDIT